MSQNSIEVTGLQVVDVRRDVLREDRCSIVAVSRFSAATLILRDFPCDRYHAGDTLSLLVRRERMPAAAASGEDHD